MTDVVGLSQFGRDDISVVATKRISSGQRVTVDGDAGTVTLISS